MSTGPAASTGPFSGRMADGPSKAAAAPVATEAPEAAAAEEPVHILWEDPTRTLLPLLPDDGPRFARPVSGAGGDLFQRGLDAHAEQRYGDASAAFWTVVEKHPHGPLADAARAFLAELQVTDGPTVQTRQLAIDAYRRIIRDFPQSPNTARAYWRIGDLYVAMNMRTEAQGAYEHGIAQLGEGNDAERAALGLAVSFAAQRRWPEAARGFTRVISRASDDVILRFGTLGLADADYMQKEHEAAEPLYEMVWRRWPDFLKERPASLLRALNNAGLTGRPLEARRLALTFYNLYPRAAEAAQALVQIGDSFRQSSQRRQALLFYGEAIRRHPEAPGASAARMRLAEMGLEQMLNEQEHQLRDAVAAMFRDEPAPSLDQNERARVLLAVAEANPKHAAGSEAFYHLGEHYEAAGDLPQMVQAYGAAVARVGRIPDDPWPAAAGRRLSGLVSPMIVEALAQQDDFKAVSLFHALWGADDAIFAERELIVKMAAVYRRVGFTPEALRLYQGLLQGRQAGPYQEEVLYNLGQAYLDQGDYPAARQVFERYRLQHPLGRWRVEAATALVRAYQGKGDQEGVVRASRRWLQLYPTHPARNQIRQSLAGALVALGQMDEALRIYADLARVPAADGKPDPAVLIHYADLLRDLKRYDEAVTRYWQALQASPDREQADWIRLQLARTWRDQAHPSAAGKVLTDLSKETSDELLARLSASMQADLAGAGKKQKGGS